ncbi:MAG: lipase family protein [Rhodococcus sp. (in: high G+C Gram-positive bacteria)]|uniref:lipase family protein n=1 Tax=Rhodococcus sp. TaxID=1831 RepID=UPI003BB79581
MIRRKLQHIAVCAAVAAAVTAGCSGADAEPIGVRAEGVFTDAPHGDQRGAIVSTADFDDIDTRISGSGATAMRVEYRSTRGSDQAGTVVSGTVFTPSGDVPTGGWTVMVLAHATTGVAQGCGPSNFSDLFGSVPDVLHYLGLGFVVALPDYQGLGPADGTGRADGTGTMPYLEPATVGYNVIDAVRAARNVVPDTSMRWLAVGGSQGGQATWAANELAGDYGDGLTLLGTASLAPPVDLTRYSWLVRNNALTAVERTFMPYLVVGMHSAHPDRVAVDDYLHGIVLDELPSILSCSSRTDTARNYVYARMQKDDVVPDSEEAIRFLEDWLASIRMPWQQAAAPMLVMWGGQDPIVAPQSVQSAVDRACDLGSTVFAQELPNAGHAMEGAEPVVTQWVEGRMAGHPAPDNC